MVADILLRREDFTVGQIKSLIHFKNAENQKMVAQLAKQVCWISSLESFMSLQFI